MYSKERFTIEIEDGREVAESLAPNLF